MLRAKAGTADRNVIGKLLTTAFSMMACMKPRGGSNLHGPRDPSGSA